MAGARNLRPGGSPGDGTGAGIRGIKDEDVSDMGGKASVFAVRLPFQEAPHGAGYFDWAGEGGNFHAMDKGDAGEKTNSQHISW